MPKKLSTEREQEFQKALAKFRSTAVWPGLCTPDPSSSDEELRTLYYAALGVLEEVDKRKRRPRTPQARGPEYPMPDPNHAPEMPPELQGKGRHENVGLRDLQPIPERDLRVDPVDRAQVDRLKESIHEHGFWGGVVCCQIDQTIYVAAGWHRIIAALELGMERAYLFVGNFNSQERIRIYGTENASQRGNEGSAPTGVVAAAIRLLAKELLTTPSLSLFKERSPHSLNQLISQMENGILGEPIITKFLGNIPRISSMSVQQQMAILKKSGEYARILREVEAEIKLERGGTAASARDDSDRIRDDQADNGTKVKKIREDAPERAVAKAEAIPITFDLAVSEILKRESQATTFRKLAYEFKEHLPLNKQGDLARELVRRYPGKSLTVKKIKEQFPQLVESVQAERQFTQQEKEALAQQDQRQARENGVKRFWSTIKTLEAEGKTLLRDWPDGTPLPEGLDSDLRELTLLIDRFSMLYEKQKDSLKNLGKAS